MSPASLVGLEESIVIQDIPFSGKHEGTDLHMCLDHVTFPSPLAKHCRAWPHSRPGRGKHEIFLLLGQELLIWGVMPISPKVFWEFPHQPSSIYQKGDFEIFTCTWWLAIGWLKDPIKRMENWAESFSGVRMNAGSTPEQNGGLGTQRNLKTEPFQVWSHPWGPKHQPLGKCDPRDRKAFARFEGYKLLLSLQLNLGVGDLYLRQSIFSGSVNCSW